MTTLKEQIKQAFPGLKENEFDNYASDLYVKVVPGLYEWLKENYEYPMNINRFIDNITKKPWLDIPFAFTEYYKS